MFRNTLIYMAFFSISGAALAADSDFDTTFGPALNGRVVIAPNAGGNNVDAPADVLVASNGKLFVIGTASAGANGLARIALARLNANGTPDESFAPKGLKVIPPAILQDIKLSVNAAAFDSSGNILIAGSMDNGVNADFMLCKVSQAGLGVKFSALNTACTTVPIDFGGNKVDAARDVTVLPDGRIMLVGSAMGDNSKEYGAIALLKPDGTPDNTFSDDGKYTFLPVGDDVVRLNAVAYSVEGGLKFKAVGEYSTTQTTALHGLVYSFDLTLSSTNTLNIQDDGLGGLYDIVMSGNGNATYVGKAYLNDGVPSMKGFIANSDYDYIATSTAGGDSAEFSRVTRQSDGKFIALGQRTKGAVTEAIVARFYLDAVRCDLLVDGTFGAQTGWAVVDFDLLPTPKDKAPRGIAWSGGRLVLGASVDRSGGDYDIGVARLGGDRIFTDGFEPMVAQCTMP